MKSANLIIDYLTFSSKCDSVKSIIDFLGFSEIPFSELNGRYFYKKRLSYEGINIYYEGMDENMGICVELSGKGCRNFEKLGTGDYNELFSYIANNQELNITRIDIAYDDYDGLLDFDTIENDIKNYNYVSRFKVFKIEKEYSKIIEKRSFCIYCGSKNQSDTLFRIYDKRAEQMRFELDHWVRFEMQLRNERADCFLNVLVAGSDLGQLFAGVINNYLRFVVRSKTDSNTSRYETTQYWFNFLGTFEKVSLYIPQHYYNETKLEKFVKTQVSGAVVAFIALFGFNAFKNVVNGKSHLALNPKYQLLLKQHGIDNIDELFIDDWWNSYD